MPDATPFETKKYYVMTLDPLHVGTGGFRLGRVDNTIVREPETNIPKIPGSSIAGVARACTALAIQSENPDKQRYRRPALNPDRTQKIKDGKPVYYSCAGKGADEGEGHCGQNTCEVCAAYGFSKNNESFQGLAQFYDARIVFFPVQTSIGPVWITSPDLLREHYYNACDIKLTDYEEQFQTYLVAVDEKINLGWLYLPNKARIAPLAVTALPAAVRVMLETVVKRLVLVPEKYFSQIVNDNLEVRTSVAINPETGAAEEHALFTYEAIPRATVLTFDIVYNDPQFFLIDNKVICKDDNTPADTNWVRENVKKGLDLMQYTGLGGMNTRGMGRIKIQEA